jgi:hypothetical protein
MRLNVVNIPWTRNISISIGPSRSSNVPGKFPALILLMVWKDWGCLEDVTMLLQV